MPVIRLLILGLFVFLTAVYSATTKEFATQCSTLMLGSQNAPAMCSPGFTMTVPTAAEAAQGQKPAITLKTKHPDYPVLTITFGGQPGVPGARGNNQQIFLEIDYINGARAGGNCLVQRNSMNRAALSFICSSGSPMISSGQILMANETAVNELFSFFAAAHDLLNPGKPLGNVAPPPAVSSAKAPYAGRAVNTYPLEGTCASLTLSSKDLTANCQPPALLQAPNTVAAGQGERPRIVLRTSDPAIPAVTFYLTDAVDQPDRLILHLFGVNSYLANPGTACQIIKSPRKLRCGGYLQLPATVIRFNLEYPLNGTEEQFQAAMRGFGDAGKAGAEVAKLDKTGGVKLSDDKLAIFGIAVGKAIPNGIPECDVPGPSQNVPFCVARESERKDSDLFDMLGQALDARMKAERSPQEAQRSLARSLTAVADPAVFRSLQMRIYGLRINPGIFDTSVLQSQGIDGNLRPRYYLSLVMGEGVVQYLSLRTTPPQWKPVFEMLQGKYGKPSQLAWETISSPLNPNVRVQVPNAAWSTQGLLVEYMGGSRVDVALTKFIDRLEELDRKRANPPPPSGPPKRKF